MEENENEIIPKKKVETSPTRPRPIPTQKFEIELKIINPIYKKNSVKLAFYYTDSRRHI